MVNRTVVVGSRLIVGVVALVVGLAAETRAQSADTETPAAQPAVTAWVVPAITDERVLPNAQPPGGTSQPQLVITATPGEFEPASFAVYANRQVANVSVDVSALAGSAGSIPSEAIDIRTVKRWYQAPFARPFKELKQLTPELLLKDDALIRVEDGENYIRLGSGEYRWISEAARLKGRLPLSVEDFSVRDSVELQPVDIEYGTNKQFWLTIKVPDATSPGIYRGLITISDEAGLLEWIPLEVEVLPFRLPPPMLTYSIYYRGQLDANWPDGSVSSEFKSEAQVVAELRNMYEHGVTNPTVYQRYQSGQLDRILALRADAEMDRQPLYYLGANASRRRDEPIPANLAGRVTATISTARRYGVPDVFFYGYDEARGDELLAQVPVWEIVRDNGGKVFVAGWHSTLDTGPGNFELVGAEQDLSISIAPVTRAESSRWRGVGRPIFSYQNPTGGWELPETWRRNYGIFLWQQDYDGGMPYAYQDSFGSGWNDFDGAVYRDHNFTYPTVDGVIDTVQWEGLREGIDDIRYLTLLLQLIEARDTDDKRDTSAANDWVADLKETPLAQLDVKWMRRKMTGYIIALSMVASNRDRPLQIRNVHHAPLDWPVAATIVWETSHRGSGQVEFGETRKLGRASEHDPARLRRHTHVLHDLQPGTRYFYRVRSIDGTGEEAVSRIYEFSTADGIEIAWQPPTPVDGFVSVEDSTEVRAGLNSRYRTSSFIDWDQSLIGWWRFSGAGEETVTDYSTHQHDARLMGDAQRVPARIGTGVTLNGDGDFVYAKDISVPENGTATIEGWFRFGSFALETKRRFGLFSGLYQHPVNNHLYILDANSFFHVAPLLKVGVWHHIALTYSGRAATAVMYIDGRRIPSIVQGKPDQDIPEIDGFSIGRSAGYFGGLIRGSSTFEGDIDEVRVWNRELSAGEIRASFAAGRGPVRAEFVSTRAGAIKYSATAVSFSDEVSSTPVRTIIIRPSLPD